MKPEPEHLSDGVTIYHADCMDVLPVECDAVVTDPPYGHGGKWTGGTWGAATVWKDARKWDQHTVAQEHLDFIITVAKLAVVWGGNYYQMPPSRCWLAWFKTNSVATMADFELAWTNIDMPSRKFLWKVNTDGPRLHAAQKPVELMAWCLKITKIAQGQTVLDPYMGSGTTGIACIRSGRKFIGIEKDRNYYEIARERLRSEMQQMRMF